MPPRRRKPPDEDTPPPGQEPGNDESPESEDSLLVHEAYLEHRLGGGEPATPEAYQRAVEQFERLPGAVPTRPGRRTTRPRPTDAETGVDAETGEARRTGGTSSGDESMDEDQGGES